MLIVLATTSSATSRKQHGPRQPAAILPASPFFVCQPISALISWIAAMKGSVSSMVQVSA